MPDVSRQRSNLETSGIKQVTLRHIPYERIPQLYRRTSLKIRVTVTAIFNTEFETNFGETNCAVNISHETTKTLDFPLNKMILTRNDDEISASPRNIGIYMILFEQNCNNLKTAAIGRNM